jgi:hypothetical protein
MEAYWTVTGDSPDQFSTVNSATPVLGHVIQFQTTNGNRGSVFVPNDHYTTAHVRAAIQVQADLADEIASLAHKQ